MQGKMKFIQFVEANLPVRKLEKRTGSDQNLKPHFVLYYLGLMCFTLAFSLFDGIILFPGLAIFYAIFFQNCRFFIFVKNFYFWSKFRFLVKISIFGQNFHFWSKFSFLVKNYICFLFFFDNKILYK